MSDLVWRREWEVGVEWIDAQHRQQLKMVNAISEAGEAELEAALEDLIAFAAHHFRDEEAEMLRLGYPGFEAHRAQHIELAAQILEIRQRAERKRPGVAPAELRSFIERWLREHLEREDRSFAEFVRASAGAASASAGPTRRPTTRAS